MLIGNIIVHLFSLFSATGLLLILFILYYRRKERSFLYAFISIFLLVISYGMVLFRFVFFRDSLDPNGMLSFSSRLDLFFLIQSVIYFSSLLTGLVSIQYLLKLKIRFPYLIVSSLLLLSYVLFHLFVLLLWPSAGGVVSIILYLSMILIPQVLYYAILIIIWKNMIKIKLNLRKLIRIILIVAAFFIFPIMMIDDLLYLKGIAGISSFARAVSFIALVISVLLISIIDLTARTGTVTLGADLDHFAKAFGLTNREQEIFIELLKGRRYKDIAVSLVISLDTVKTHVSKIYRKTHASARQELKYIYRDFLEGK